MTYLCGSVTLSPHHLGFPAASWPWYLEWRWITARAFLHKADLSACHGLPWPRADRAECQRQCHSMGNGKWNVARRIRKQRMWEPSAIEATPRGALRELRMETQEECRPVMSHWINHQPPPTGRPVEAQDEKARDLGPRQLRCRSKDWLQWAQTLASCHT